METSLPETYKILLPQGPGKIPKYESKPLPKPGKNEVLVKIAFAPINPMELSLLYTGAPTVNYGIEGSGTVVAIGENLNIPHKIGDKVHVYGPGTYAEYLVLASDKCYPIQGDLSLERAASHIVNPGTVVFMGHLVEKGGHKAAIISAGNSAVGRMAIRYFKQKGIKLISIVRRDDFNEEMKKDGVDHILNSTAPDFDAKLKEIAEKENATISFDGLCGDFPGKLLKAQPPGSVCYLYGAVAGELEVKGINVFDVLKGNKIVGLNLYHYVDEKTKAGELRQFFHEVHSQLATTLSSEVVKVFTLDKLEEAIAFSNQNRSKGKVLLKPN